MASFGEGELDGVEDEGEGLGSAHAAVRTDELLERRDLVEVGPIGAVDDDVRAVGEPVGAQDVAGSVGPEWREWIVALDAVFVEVVDATGADGQRAVQVGPHEQEADAGVVALRRS